MLQGLFARARALSTKAANDPRVAQSISAIGQALTSILKTAIAWLLAAIWWVLRALRWLLVPLNKTPLDFLKHYASLTIVLTGFIGLWWVGAQIVHPPLVITVAKLPSQLEQESWLNAELSRALMNELERLRAVVKGDRDPGFEAVLNAPPPISIKTGDFSFNVQEQLLTPLATLLGRGQGEVHLAVTCFHPGCLRTKDPECTNPVAVPTPKPLDFELAKYLCLRLAADVQRLKSYRRLMLRLTLSNDSYDIDLTRQMLQIAEEVTSVADPATAALYFYRRVKQENDAARSLTYDPELLADLRIKAFRAAELAENQDAVAKCWAYTVRAHLAIDQREFSLAVSHLARANKLTWWDHISHFTRPDDCHRLVAIGEMELARQLARPAGFSAYPQHAQDDNDKRLAAAQQRIADLMDGNTADAFFGLFSNRIDDADLRGAIRYARAEIGLAWYSKAEQCGLLDGRWAPANPDAASDSEATDDDGIDRNADRIRFNTWPVVRRTLDRLQKLPPERPLSPLTRQAAMDLLEAFAANEVCPEKVQAVGRALYLAHPADAKVTQLFAQVTEAAATAKSRNLRHPADIPDRGNEMLGYAKSLYERLLDIGGDKVDVIALSRLAFITEAFHADNGSTVLPKFGPVPETLLNVTRAWKRYQQQNYPTHTRHHAEFLVSFWGALLLRHYRVVADDDLSVPFAGLEASKQEQIRSAKANFVEFKRALGFLFPDSHHAKFAEFPKIRGIGQRIGCLCMLSHAVYENEIADFLIARIDAWRDPKSDMSKCQDDLIPVYEKLTFEATRDAEKKAKDIFSGPNDQLLYMTEVEESLKNTRAGLIPSVDEANIKLREALDELESAAERTPHLERRALDRLKAVAAAKADAMSNMRYSEAWLEGEKPKVPALTQARDEARAVLEKASDAAYEPRRNWEKKQRNLTWAAEACRVGG